MERRFRWPKSNAANEDVSDFRNNAASFPRRESHCSPARKTTALLRLRGCRIKMPAQSPHAILKAHAFWNLVRGYDAALDFRAGFASSFANAPIFPSGMIMVGNKPTRLHAEFAPGRRD
jgi:hypothetical protein